MINLEKSYRKTAIKSFLKIVFDEIDIWAEEKINNFYVLKRKDEKLYTGKIQATKDLSREVKKIIIQVAKSFIEGDL